MDCPSSASKGFPSQTFWCLFFSPKNVPSRVTGLQVSCFATETKSDGGYSLVMLFSASAMGHLIMDTTEACGEESSFARCLERTHTLLSWRIVYPFFTFLSGLLPLHKNKHKLTGFSFEDLWEPARALTFASWSTLGAIAASQDPCKLHCSRISKDC